MISMACMFFVFFCFLLFFFCIRLFVCLFAYPGYDSTPSSSPTELNMAGRGEDEVRQGEVMGGVGGAGRGGTCWEAHTYIRRFLGR